MRQLSPELALVDEHLARSARAALPPAPDVLAAIVRHRDSRPVRRLRAALVADALPEPRRARRPVLRFLAGGLVVLGAIGGAAFALRAEASHRAAPIPTAHVRLPAARAERAVQVPTAPVETAKPPACSVGHAVSKPATTPLAEHLPVLTWAADGQATYYRVDLFRDGTPPTPVCTVWTDAAQLALASVSTPAGRPLNPGEYRWVVYHVFGGDGSLGSGGTADKRLTQGTFTL
jgi:hypothetical protein